MLQCQQKSKENFEETKQKVTSKNIENKQVKITRKVGENIIETVLLEFLNWEPTELDLSNLRNKISYKIETPSLFNKSEHLPNETTYNSQTKLFNKKSMR